MSGRRTAAEAAPAPVPREGAAGPRIAVDLRSLVTPPTGTGIYARSLLGALARRGRLRLLGLSHLPAAHAAGLVDEGVELEHEGALSGVVWQQTVLPRRLARGDVDALWSPLFTLPWRPPVPAVTTVHDLTPLLFPRAHRPKVRWSIRPFLGRSLAVAERIVVDSHATRHDVATRYPLSAGRLEVVYPGVDPEFAPAGEEAIAAVRRRLGCPRGYLLYFGTLEPRKDVGSLLAAWESLRGRTAEPLPLVIAGPYGWGSRRLLGRLRAHAGRGVVLTGRLPRPRLVEVVQAASILAYPSLYEGFGLPVVEAMACGVPAVVSDASSLPEVVGEAALRVPPGDPGALAAAIARLAADPALAADLGERGRERVRRFTWERAAERMEGILLDAAGRG